MTRTLLLLRHAKSSWRDPGRPDVERPLNKRGRTAAPAMGRYLHARGLVPAIILCSAATRAQETLAGAEPEFHAKIPVKVLKSLYGAAPSRLLEVVRALSDSAASALLIGHNPGLHHLALRLAGPDSGAAALRKLNQKFPTAALAVFHFEVARWRDVSPGLGRLERVVWPRELD